MITSSLLPLFPSSFATKKIVPQIEAWCRQEESAIISRMMEHFRLSQKNNLDRRDGSFDEKRSWADWLQRFSLVVNNRSSFPHSGVVIPTQDGSTTAWHKVDSLIIPRSVQKVEIPAEECPMITPSSVHPLPVRRSSGGSRSAREEPLGMDDFLPAHAWQGNLQAALLRRELLRLAKPVAAIDRSHMAALHGSFERSERGLLTPTTLMRDVIEGTESPWLHPTFNFLSPFTSQKIHDPITAKKQGAAELIRALLAKLHNPVFVQDLTLLVTAELAASGSFPSERAVREGVISAKILHIVIALTYLYSAEGVEDPFNLVMAQLFGESDDGYYLMQLARELFWGGDSLSINGRKRVKTALQALGSRGSDLSRETLTSSRFLVRELFAEDWSMIGS